MTTVHMGHSPEITADQMLIDGWAQGITVEEMLTDLQAHGFMASRTAIVKTWLSLDEQYPCDI